MQAAVSVLSDPVAPAKLLARHYPSEAAKVADLVVHIVGLVFALIAGTVLMVLAIQSGNGGLIAAIGVYATGMVAMLAFSTSYNFANDTWRPRLHRLDHVGITLMIAASYTPFTTQVLGGEWAWTLTGIVWVLAMIGIAARLFAPVLPKLVWVVYYVALGWVALVAIGPMTRAMGPVPMLLLGIGGLIYTFGVVFYINKSITFHRAIWHVHVVAAAAVQWVAVLLGVVLVQA